MSPELPKLVINIDDLGMCHGANAAYLALFQAGRCDSGSVMVPCPWFLEITAAGVADPALKLGVHLTITAEKRFYRWRPLTAPGPGSGLVDPQGYFWGSVPEVRRRADPQAVEKELRAQIDGFLAAGLTPTHLDAHQGAVLAPEFAPITIALGREYGVPILFPRTIDGYGPIHNLGPLDPAIYADRAADLARSGALLVDRVLETPWHQDGTAEDRYRALFAEIGPGVNFMALHANAPGEIEAIEPASARIRTDEYAVLGASAWIDDLEVERGTLKDFSMALSAS
ncbi:polysaccharide deacetylase family protein [Lichenifustis flavocetrariae]|uniref:Polysaccharide deacetylase family protein n=1 Tax=Lichenifustis flavocetrariae TaxID=2949735 RepID=A0AA42CMQ6_9HYPH|nr:polysaccharide deacetylase family protein [Lichenifustis flavocetrariae]MCW6511836.1 polysaccharide deacetylase family protein [Lichenifustis flavocetrariae]